MLATTGTGFTEMRITKVVGFGPPLAEDCFWCVVLDGLSGDSPLVIEIGEMESLSLGAALSGRDHQRSRPRQPGRGGRRRPAPGGGLGHRPAVEPRRDHSAGEAHEGEAPDPWLGR